MVVIERDQPLESMELIVLELSALEDGGLLGDFFLDGVREVVVDRVGALEYILQVFLFLSVCLLSRFLLGRSLLNQYFRAQFFQEAVGLAEQLSDLSLFLLFHQLKVDLHILSLQFLQSGNLLPFLQLLLLFSSGLDASLHLSD
jgi:hypothetical protein